MTTRLYYSDIRKLEQTDFDRLIKRMPEERKKKILQRKQKKDRLRSLTAGLLLQEALKEENLVDTSFGYDHNGKPVLFDHPEVWISITHSGDYAGILLSDRPCGIDIQEYRGMKESLTRYLLHKAEKPVTEPEKYYELFSKKEAMVKVHGFRTRFSEMDTTTPPAAYGFRSFPLEGYSFVVYAPSSVLPELKAENRLLS